MGHKLIVSLPINVVQFRYNDFIRDFEGAELDFGRIVFRKDTPAQSEAQLRCTYCTDSNAPYWYTEEINVSLDQGERHD